MSPYLIRQLNALAVLGIAGILTYAFIDQLALHDLPCPLCILQRAGFAIAGFGFALNLLFGCRPSHYALVILGAVAGASISVRQVMLHIAPGTGSYGEALFGLHFYTWAFIAFVLIIIGAAILLLMERQFFEGGWEHESGWARAGRLGKVAVAALGVLVVANALSTLAECGVGLCPDDPTGYELLDS